MTENIDPYYTWLGIPPAEQPPNHYRLLGLILFEENPTVIDNAADRQMSHVRTMGSGPHGEVAQRILNQIATARVCLLNQEKRAEYDSKLRAQIEAGQTAAGARGGGAPVPHADPAQPFDESRDIIQTPSLTFPPPQRVSGAATRALPSGRRSRLSRAATAAVIGVIGGALVAAVLAFLFFKPSSARVAPGSAPGKTGVQIGASQRKAETTGGRPVNEIGKPTTPPNLPKPETATPASAPPPGAWDHVDLGTATVKDDYVRITEQSFIATRQEYSGPIEIVVVARTTSENIRLDAYKGACVIFNWETNPTELRVTRPDGGEKAESGSLATARVKPLKPGTWYRLMWRITADGMDVFVNDERVFSERRTYDLSVKGRVRVRSGKGVVDVKELRVVDGLSALRFHGRDYVELADTVGALDLSKSFTIETWARWDSSRVDEDMYVAGDEAWPMMSKEVPVNKACGWVIRTWKVQGGDKRSVEFNVGATVRGRNDWLGVKTQPQRAEGTNWQHIAVVKTNDSIKVFWNGKQSAQASCSGVTFHNAPTNLFLGVRKNAYHNRQFHGDIRAFRVSSTALYSTDFEPAESFRADSATVVFLDFSRRGESAVSDLSGNHHDGRLGGAKWIGVAPVVVINGPETQHRQSTPGLTELKAARQQLLETFDAKINEAKTAQDKAGVADALLTRAGEKGSTGALQYALLDEAARLGVEAGDVARAVRANEQLAQAFDVDGAAKLVETFNALVTVNLTTDQRKALVEALSDTADSALAGEDFKTAAELSALLKAAAEKGGDAGLRRKAALVKDRLDQTRTWWEQADAARPVLAAKPDDSTANTAVGRYMCFVSGDWENGLPHLAKSEDAKLRAAAALELSTPDTAVKQALVGDAWWSLAAPATGYWKLVLQKRAGYWYQKAVGDLKGPVQAAVEDRLIALEKALGEGAGGVTTAVLAKRILGDFVLSVASKKESAKKSTTIHFAANGTVSDNQQRAGTWAVESNQIRVTNDNLGTVLLRSRDKDTFVGTQTRDKSDTLNWELKRVVIASVWDVYDDGVPGVAPERLVLYSNGKGNDIYGSTTWTLKGNFLTLDWPNYRSGRRLEGTFRMEPGSQSFRGVEERNRLFRGKRVATGQK